MIHQVSAEMVAHSYLLKLINMKRKMYISIETKLYYISVKAYNEILYKYFPDGRIDTDIDSPYSDFLDEIEHTGTLVDEVLCYCY
jgi:hypothetical protein